MKKNKNLKPNPFMWFIYATCSKIIMKFKYNVSYDRKEFKRRKKKEGCIVIYNHQCNDDHFILTSLFGNKNKVNYVMTKRFFFTKSIRTFLPTVKVIARDQFKNDTYSIRMMRRVVDNGGILCIAPAGQVTVHGEMPYIHPSIVKLLKLCKVDVYTIQIRGTYLAYPKWGKEKRRYPINAKIGFTISKEDILSKDNDYIYNKVVDSINICDRDYQKGKMVPIKGNNLASGLENVLFLCPKCQKKYTIEVNNNIIKCNNCGNTVRYNQYGFLEGIGNDYVLMQDESLWYYYQRDYLKNQIRKGNYKLISEVDFYANNHYEYHLDLVGHGTLYFENNELYYIGTRDNEPYRKDFSLSQIFQLPFAPGKRFNIPDDEGMFEFQPEIKKEVIEWVLAIQAYYEVNLEREQNDLQ